MTDRMKRERYSSISMLLHWIIAALVLYNLIIGPGVYGLEAEAKPPKLALHATIGATILILMIVRLIWRLVNRPPAYPDDMPSLFRKGATVSHFLFYALLIAQPLLGAMTALFINYDVVVFGAINVSGLAKENMALSDAIHVGHSIVGLVLLLLIVIHVFGGLIHMAFRRDGVMSSMFPWGRRTKAAASQ